MIVGHIYKKGKSYYLCYDWFKTCDEDEQYAVVNINGIEIWDVKRNEQDKYTHIGKAIDLIKRGAKYGL